MSLSIKFTKENENKFIRIYINDDVQYLIEWMGITKFNIKRLRCGTLSYTIQNFGEDSTSTFFLKFYSNETDLGIFVGDSQLLINMKPHIKNALIKYIETAKITGEFIPVTIE